MGRGAKMALSLLPSGRSDVLVQLHVGSKIQKTVSVLKGFDILGLRAVNEMRGNMVNVSGTTGQR